MLIDSCPDMFEKVIEVARLFHCAELIQKIAERLNSSLFQSTLAE
jgi:hypothetical protein